jgi:hypothetical protein
MIRRAIDQWSRIATAPKWSSVFPIDVIDRAPRSKIAPVEGCLLRELNVQPAIVIPVFRSGDELALRRRRARVHVAAAVHVVVNLSGAAEHTSQ